MQNCMNLSMKQKQIMSTGNYLGLSREVASPGEKELMTVLCFKMCPKLFYFTEIIIKSLKNYFKMLS